MGIAESFVGPGEQSAERRAQSAERRELRAHLAGRAPPLVCAAVAEEGQAIYAVREAGKFLVSRLTPWFHTASSAANSGGGGEEHYVSHRRLD